MGQTADVCLSAIYVSVFQCLSAICVSVFQCCQSFVRGLNDINIDKPIESDVYIINSPHGSEDM